MAMDTRRVPFTVELDHDQRPRCCVGCRESNRGLLELRVPLGEGEEICDVFVHEESLRVAVEVLVCGEPAGIGSAVVPVPVFLERALGGRPVYDLVGECVVPQRRGG